MERSDKRLRRFEEHTAWPMMILALVATAVIIVELVVPEKSLSSGTRAALRAADIAIIAVFAVEYLVRLLLLAPDRWQFVKTHVLDVLVLIPNLQAFRLLRSVRILRASRFLRAGLFVGKSVHESKHVLSMGDIPRVLALCGVAVVVAAGLAFGIERQEPDADITTFGNSLWWAVSTAMTTGSRLEPVSFEGRIIALVLMLLGISLISAIAGIFASEFVLRRRQGQDMRDVLAKLEDLERRLPLTHAEQPQLEGATKLDLDGRP